MSQIFEALQHAIGKGNGEKHAATPTATALLERAERSAVAARRQDPREREALRSPAGELAGAPAESVPHPKAPSSGAPAVTAPAETFRSLTVSSPDPRLAFVAAPESAGAEAIRLLAVRVRDLQREKPLPRILITSTTTREGKSLLAANLACALGRGARVLLLEGDIRRPTLCGLFGLEPQPGLCEWLESEAGVESAVYQLAGAGICLLPAGVAPAASLDALRSHKLAQLMEKASAWFDVVLIDSPPVLPLADASIWERLADGVLLVTRQGITEKRKLEKGLQALQGPKLLGAILNSCSSFEEGVYSYYRTPHSAGAAHSPASE